MLNYRDEGYEEAQTEEALNYIVSFLEERDSWETPHKYTILEYFPKETDNPLTYVPNVYELYNLKIDSIQNGIIIFDDGEGILEESLDNNTPLPLHHFCVDNIIYIGFQNEPENHFTISLDYGFIQIYY